jgi:hypothetical protein
MAKALLEYHYAIDSVKMVNRFHFSAILLEGALVKLEREFCINLNCVTLIFACRGLLTHTELN